MPEWYVYYNNFNQKCIEKYNIFQHGFFRKDVEKAVKAYRDDFEGFCKELDSSLMYWFWAKCEWEIVLSDFPPSDSFKKEKIDVYQQVKLNWNIFVQYVWNYYFS